MRCATIGFLRAVVFSIVLAFYAATAQEVPSNVAILPNSTSESLLDLAKSSALPNLESAAFKAFCDAAASGTDFVMSSNISDREEVEHWDPNRTIPVKWIFWLCTDPKAKLLVSNRGIDLRGVRMKERLDLKSRQIPFPIAASNCVFDGGVDLSNAHLPTVTFEYCSLGSLTGVKLNIDATFSIQNSDIGKNNANSIVHLDGVTIGESLLFNSTDFDGLDIDSANINGSVNCKNNLAPLTVYLQGTTIGGSLDCSQCRFHFNEFFFPNGEHPSTESYAIDATGAKIGMDADFYLAAVDGEICLEGATVGRNLILTGATLTGRSRHYAPSNPQSLTATGAKIGQNVLLDGFRTGVELQSYLGFDLGVNGEITFKDASIAGTISWDPIYEQPKAILDLTRAKASRLFDNVSSPPAKGKLFIDGFLFDRLEDGAPSDSQSQIKWLRLQPDAGIRSQPYDQMATAFRNMGLTDNATDVLIAQNWDHAGAFYPSTWFDFFDFNKLVALLWFRGVGWLIGYGYRPANALWFFFFFLFIGFRVFRNAYRDGIIVPTKPNADQIAHYPKFHPLIYSLETFIPLLKLAMGEYWSPSDTNDRPIFSLLKLKFLALCFLYGKREADLRLARLPKHSHVFLVRHYLWIHIVFGWIVTSLLVAGLSGILKKN